MLEWFTYFHHCIPYFLLNVWKAEADAVPDGGTELAERDELAEPEWHTGGRDGARQDHPSDCVPRPPQRDRADDSQ